MYVFTNVQTDNCGTSSGEDGKKCVWSIEGVEMLLSKSMVGRAADIFNQTLETGGGGGRGSK